jgi:CHAT domain
VREAIRARRLLVDARARTANANAPYEGQIVAAQRLTREARALVEGRSDRASRIVLGECMGFSGRLESLYGEVESGIVLLCAAAAILTPLADDLDSLRSLASAYRSLANASMGIGLRALAEELAVEYLRTLPAEARAFEDYTYTGAMLATGGHPAQLGHILERWQPESFSGPERCILTIFRERTSSNRSSDTAGLVAAARGLAPVALDLRIQCTLFAATTLMRRQEPSAAVEILRELTIDRRIDSVTHAKVLQAMGRSMEALGDVKAAQCLYLEAWTRYDDVRYEAGSLNVRRSVMAESSACRLGALRLAVHQQDWSQLMELIESSRLQAAYDLPGSAADMDETLTTGQWTDRPSPDAAVTIAYDTLPDACRRVVDTVQDLRADVANRVDLYVDGHCRLAEARQSYRNGTDHLRLDIADVITRTADPTAQWWSTSVEENTLIWVISQSGVPYSGGVFDLDDDIREALTVASFGHGITPPWPVPDLIDEVEDLMAVADSFEEIQFTGTLARLLPRELIDAPNSGGRLLMSIAPELAAVPWPVLPINTAASPAIRLIERFDLKSIPSISVLNGLIRGASPNKDVGSERPLLLLCDCLPSPEPNRSAMYARAQIKLTDRKGIGPVPGTEPATSLNLGRFLRSVVPGTAGVVYFRGHYVTLPSDPVSSGLQLADDVLPCALFGAHDQTTGQPILGLPDTVVLACCSTSGGRERNGGETLGMASMALRAGARRVLATSVDIHHNTFTAALDEMLAEIAIQPGDHVAALHQLQLRLLNEWRRFSLRDVPELRETTPTPYIWAHIQAIGD